MSAKGVKLYVVSVYEPHEPGARSRLRWRYIAAAESRDTVIQDVGERTGWLSTVTQYGAVTIAKHAPTGVKITAKEVDLGYFILDSGMVPVRTH